MEWRQTAHVVTRKDAPPPTDAMMPPAGEHAIVGTQYPHGMHNVAAMYASSVSIDMARYEDLLGHHLLSIWNLITTTNDESYRSSAGETPPATLRAHAVWDFSGVPDPVTFR
jgi:hypothetical protein